MSHDALFQLGMDFAPQSTTQTEEHNTIDAGSDIELAKDHFIEKDGVRCAGSHLIIDLYGAEKLDDIDHIEQAMVECVEESGATLLHIHLHRFEPMGCEVAGVSGVAVLAESHISIHSWPENGYAALDVFMCGDAEPEKCVNVLRRAFSPDRIAVSEILRGKGA
jgi:S-adenosylmethionine decarboxylase